MKPDGYTNGTTEYIKHYRKQGGLLWHVHIQCHLNKNQN